MATVDSAPWYEARPRGGCGPGVLLLHSAFGFKDCHRGMCDLLAEEGFTVVAPDLFDGETASLPEEAERLRAMRRSEDRWATIGAAAARLRRIAGPDRPIGVVGLSLGGHWALFLSQLASLPVKATVVYYAVRGGDYRSSRSAFQVHLAEKDEYVTTSGVARLRRNLESAGRPAEFYVYDGTRHWFCDRDQKLSFDAGAAELSWKRTVDFLQRSLAPVHELQRPGVH